MQSEPVLLIEPVARKILLEDPEFASHSGGRIYQALLPRDPEFPSVIYHNITQVRDKTTGILQTRIQYTCMAESWREAADLASLISCILPGYRGLRDGVRIEEVEFKNQYSEDYDADTKIHSIPVDIKIIWR